MTKMEKATHFSRRSLLKAGGALVISIGMPVGADTVLGISQARAQGTKPPLTPDQLSSYIAVNADGTVDAYFGKTDMAQGLFTAIGQIVAEELDVPYKAVKVIMGQTRNSVNQGGASGSTGIQFGGKQMRYASAEARRVLVDMAAAKLNIPADRAHGHRRRRPRQERPEQEGVLRRADRRAVLQHAARMEQADRQRALRARQGAAEELQGAQDRRPADPARRRRAGRVCQGSVRQRRAGAEHGARPHDPSAGRGRGAGEVRRSLGQGHPGRARGARRPFVPRRRRRHRMGRDPGRPAAQDRMVGRQAAVPGQRQRDLRSHPQGAGARQGHRRQAGRRRRRGVQDRRARDRARVRMAVPVPCQHGSGLRRRRCETRPRHGVDRLAEAALLPRRRRRDPRHEAEPGRGHLAAGGGRLWPQRRRRCLHRRRGAVEGGRPSGAAAILARGRHRLGSERPRLHPSREGRPRLVRQRDRLRVLHQGVLALGRADQREPARAHARRPLPRRAAEVGRRFRRSRRDLHLRQQEVRGGRPSTRCSNAPRRCAPRICATRSVRRSSSRASCSGTRSRIRSASTRSSSA